VAMHEHPWATPILLVALGVAFAAIFGKVQPMVFGTAALPRLPHRPALIPVFVHLALVLLLGCTYRRISPIGTGRPRSLWLTAKALPPRTPRTRRKSRSDSRENIWIQT